MAASGNGPKRTATVAFASAAGEKKFLLVHSRLTPAKALVVVTLCVANSEGGDPVLEFITR